MRLRAVTSPPRKKEREAKKMKVAFTKEAKKFVTIEEAPVAKQIIEECKEYDLSDLAQTAARVAGGQETYEILKATAEIAKNARVYNYYESNSGTLDVWLEFYAYNWYRGFFEIGVYLSDIWQLDGDNSEEIKSRMYLRECKATR